MSSPNTLYAVYLDNFRGFQKEFIPTAPVTFLVGENSSGKSSFLAAMELLTSFQFWAQPKFNTSGVKLGSFNDIVSLNAKRRDYFTIGWCSGSQNSEGHSDFAFAVLTFKEKNQRPRLHRFSLFTKKGVAKIQYGEKKVGYKVEAVPENLTLNEFCDLFTKTSNEHYKQLRKLNEVKDPDSHRQLYSPFLGPQWFLRDILENTPPPVLFAGYSFNSVAPIRTQPSTIYDAVEADSDNLGSHTPYVLRRELSGSHSANSLHKDICKFGQQSGLFKDLSVHTFGRSDESPSGSGAPFEIGIVLEDKPINLSYVGYGVSQILPIVVDSMLAEDGSSFIIQQPEVHLHPRAQAAFGELVFDLAADGLKHFYIETHSDFVIDRFRLAIAQSSGEPEFGAASLFFERKQGFNHVEFIDIESNGKYSETAPKAFREFFIKEKMELLKV